MNGYINPLNRHSLGRVGKDKSTTIISEAQAYPPLTVLIFLIFCAYMALPIFDIPLLGLSLSAPLIYFVALQVFFKPPEPWIGRYRRWIGFAAAIWLGLAISAIVNGLISGGNDFNSSSVVILIRYFYWLLVFIITTYFVSRVRNYDHVTSVLIGAIFTLALFRLGEAIFNGNIGDGKDYIFLARNEYGFLFSTFGPLALVMLVRSRNWFISLIVLLSIGIAIAINASRGSWVALSMSSLLFLWMYLRSKDSSSRDGGFLRGVFVLVFFIVVMGGMISILPTSIKPFLNERVESFTKLDEDKSYVIRQLMIQKGWRLFRESPLVGIGTGRFRVESVRLELPEILKYTPEVSFNSRSAHNAYVLILAESGLAGAIPYYLLVITLLVKGYPAAIRIGKNGNICAIAVFVCFVSMSINLWSSASITGTTPWFIYGLIASIIYLSGTQSILKNVNH